MQIKTVQFLIVLSIFSLIPRLLLDSADAAQPRALLPGTHLELVASEPRIVTPVGMAFDHKGRLLVIESHTHKREENYDGPPGDRVLMFSDSDGDGTLDQRSVFAEGFQQAMNLLPGVRGQVYLVTRRSVDRLVDKDDDGRMDEQKPVLRLETKENYPHNALSGIAHDGQGGLLVGMGENFGSEYELIGTDDIVYRDHGGVGTIFQCTREGKSLRRFCNGFWNPFSICTLPGGAVFMVDNDPDSSPPCRLIHAVESGDYGHRYEYTRAGTHPLQAWDGELPGTLPMLAGTGEAPCAVVPHRGYLWVTSWGDHRLERYELSADGATFKAKQTIAVQGDSDFRPTGCAVAPDGSLYFADWVDHSYPVHGKGRIWRLRFDEESPEAVFPERQAASPVDTKSARRVLDSADLFERQLGIATWARNLDSPAFSGAATADDASVRLAYAQACRWSGDDVADEQIKDWLNDTDAAVRFYALRWVADERIQSLREDVAKLLEKEISDERYYLSVLSALEWLDGEPTMRSSTLNDGLLVRELKNDQRSPQLHALALRLLSPDHEFLSQERLRGYLQSDFQALRMEAVRSLALQTNPERFALLAEVAQDIEQSDTVRAEAIAGLAATVDYKDVLVSLADDTNAVVREEARRVQQLTGQRAAIEETKPSADDLEAWNQLLADKGDPAAGRRLFFSARGARCAVCHQYAGRGGKIGPELTRISESNSRAQIIASILQPSREMAPHYQPWVLQTTAGKTLVGLRLHKAGDGGEEIYSDAEGQPIALSSEEIELRQASDKSIMPGGLERTLSIDQLRDLVEFLCQEQ